MKWAIDKLFKIGLINGWVSANDGNEHSLYYITIRTPEKTVFHRLANNLRPDVKAAGFHINGRCGFSFNARKNGIREGDLLIIEIKSEDEKERFTHSFLYAEKSETKKEFHRLEIPRNDFSIMQKETHLLFQEYPHWIALKIMLIRLRRFKRAKGWRIKFSGIEYEHFHSDWSFFYNIISTYGEAIFDNLEMRNIFSITDTIADYSDPQERSAALALSFYMYHERFAQTLHPLNRINSFEHLNPSTQYPIWGAMASTRLVLDDALDVYLTRAYEVLENSPLILSYFEKIMLITMSEKNSIFNRNIKNSDYFSEVWCVYRDKFNRDLIKTLGDIKF